MRAKHIDEDKVALLAYLKDPVAQGLFFSFVRTGCFLYFDHALGNREPADTFGHIRKWGDVVTIKAGCGVIKALARKFYKIEPAWVKDVDFFANNAHLYKPHRHGRYGSRVWSKEESGLGAAANTYKRRFKRLSPATSAFSSLIFYLSRGYPNPGIDVLRIGNGHLDDSTMWLSMVEYLKPWALGEYV
jgi:hypothetical protein